MDDFEFFPEKASPVVSEKLKRAQSLVGTNNIARDNDYYPTPPEATQALLNVETFSGSIFEPACGDGAICKVLLKNGYANFIASDLIDRGYGTGGIDFLKCDTTADNIITNPPFILAEEFVRHSLTLTTGKVVMLCKLQFLEGAKRRLMFESTPLARVWVFSKRITMWKNGEAKPSSSMMAFAWYVWEHGYQGKPTIGWIQSSS